MVDHSDTASEQDLCGARCIHLDRIAFARSNGLSVGEYEAMAGLFKVMGDPNRLRILWALGDGEMCVCDLAALLGSSESAVSHQLRLLRQMALVSNRRQGQVLYYRLNDEHVRSLINLTLKHIRE